MNNISMSEPLESFTPKPQQLSTPKKAFWLLFSLFVILTFTGIPILIGKSLLNTSNVLPLLSLLIILNLPLFITYVIFLFWPLILKNRFLISGLALFALIDSHLFVKSIVPLTYLWPNILLLVAYYLIFYICGAFIIYPIGKLLAKIMEDWLISYKSPQTISDLTNQVPTNIKNTFQIEGLRIVAAIVLFIFLVVSALVTSARPAIWGLGVFELNLTFPDMGVFQAKAYQRFFNQPLDGSFSINNFSRKPLISRCWSNLPSSITNNYWLFQPVDREIGLSQDNGTKQMGVAVINNACSLNSDELTQENKDDAIIYQLSDNFFQIAYPGDLQNETGGSSLRTSITGAINQQYESEKKRLWVRKNNALICSSSDSFDVDQLVSVAKNFKSSRLDTSHCSQTVIYKSPVTPGKLVFTLNRDLSKEEMQKVLNAYGTSSCENRWPNEYWSFLCTVSVGSEDKIIDQTKNDRNIDKVSR